VWPQSQGVGLRRIDSLPGRESNSCPGRKIFVLTVGAAMQQTTRRPRRSEKERPAETSRFFSLGWDAFVQWCASCPRRSAVWEGIACNRRHPSPSMNVPSIQEPWQLGMPRSRTSCTTRHYWVGAYKPNRSPRQNDGVKTQLDKMSANNRLRRRLAWQAGENGDSHGCQRAMGSGSCCCLAQGPLCCSSRAASLSRQSLSWFCIWFS